MSAPVSVNALPTRARSPASAALALVRWPNALIAGAGVLLGAWWARADRFLTGEVAVAVLSAWLVTAAVNALNDAYDVDIDRIAHPDRPGPRGELSPRAAMRIGFGAMLLAFLVVQLASDTVETLVLAALVGAYAYALGFSRQIFLANLLVAVVASMPFVVGAAAVGDAGAGLALLAVAIPLHFAREVMKDLADVEGDAGHRRTVAIAWGAGAARGLAATAVAAYAGVATFLFAYAGLRLLALLPSVALAWWAAVRGDARRAPHALKLAMLLAMAALPLLR